MVRQADAHPEDVAAQIAAAYACDREGLEQQAIRYYDSAWRLGVPATERRDFLVGYGSTLRNGGRVEESLAWLGEAVAEFPADLALRSFLALALHSAGRSTQAVATLLRALVECGGEGIEEYRRALLFYAEELETK